MPRNSTDRFGSLQIALHWLMYWHRHVAEWGYWLPGIHAGAALFHHCIVKDNTLRRME